MKIGDIVVRKSYNKDIKFKIVDIKNVDGEDNYILKGKSIRIIADAFYDDLELVNNKNEDSLSQVVKGKIRQATLNRKRYDFRCDKYVKREGKKNDDRIFSGSKKKRVYLR